MGLAVQVRLRPLTVADRERGDTGCVAVRPASAFPASAHSRLGAFPLGTFSRLGRGAGSARARRRRDEAVPLRPRLRGHQVAVGAHEYGYSRYSPSPLHGRQVRTHSTHEYGYSRYSPSPLHGHQVAAGTRGTLGRNATRRCRGGADRAGGSAQNTPGVPLEYPECLEYRGVPA